MKLKSVEICKYKCIKEPQKFNIEEDITVLVGMNESGKTSILEALAKTNYYDSSNLIAFEENDYPKSELSKIDDITNISSIKCKYILSTQLENKVINDYGVDAYDSEVTVSTNYKNSNSYLSNVDVDNFLEYKYPSLNKKDKESIKKCKFTNDITKIINEKQEDKKLIKILESLKNNYFFSADETSLNYSEDSNFLTIHFLEKYILPSLPKIVYYNTYFSLPHEINLTMMKEGKLNYNDGKIAESLFNVGKLKVEEIIDTVDSEKCISKLELAQSRITDKLREFWDNEKDFEIRLSTHKNKLIIRIFDNATKDTLSLKNMSKGFQWFFSLIVMLKSLQNENNRYVLLLDEPGLHLHPSAQDQLLKFFENIGEKHQIIFTTHSPFMINSDKLCNIRTVTNNEKGSYISNSIEENNPDTLQPLRSALGYNLAQNLFISEKNLIVEGLSDYLYLTIFSEILKENDRESLNDDITLFPVRGVDNVISYIQLMKCNKLNVVCLLDTLESKKKNKIDDLIEDKVIEKEQIMYYHEFKKESKKADVEDMFSKEEYLGLYNSSFNTDIKVEKFNDNIENITRQIAHVTNKKRFGHNTVAKHLVSISKDPSFFEEETLERFEKIFQKINKMF